MLLLSEITFQESCSRYFAMSIPRKKNKRVPQEIFPRETSKRAFPNSSPVGFLKEIPKRYLQERFPKNISKRGLKIVPRGDFPGVCLEIPSSVFLCALLFCVCCLLFVVCFLWFERFPNIASQYRVMRKLPEEMSQKRSPSPRPPYQLQLMLRIET